MAKRAITIAAIATAAVLLAVLVATRPQPTPATSTSDPTPTPTSSRSPALAPSVPPRLRLPATTDPDRYAAAVAGLVFGMDTRTGDPGDYRAALLAGADPALSTTGRADLVRTVDDRIPTLQVWERMSANTQYSTFTATQVTEPGTWAGVVTTGQAEPGWVLRNVTGIQDTRYIEAGTPKTATRERTLTVGMRCPAPNVVLERCHLLLVGTTVLP